eukprot:4796059-Prorocentrum_lima.AAC.1
MIIANGTKHHIQRMVQPGAEGAPFRDLENHFQQRQIDKWPQRGAKDRERAPPVITHHRDPIDM